MNNSVFTLHPLADLFLYTSPTGRPVPLHFTNWQTCSFTLHQLADLFLYISPIQQTYSFMLHLLADLFLYTSPAGRPVPLHFTPWQTCSFTLHQLDPFLYTSPPGRPIPSNTNSTSLGSIQSCCSYYTKTVSSLKSTTVQYLYLL